ncbi:MAG: PRC-barrel domain-containing protein [Acetobacteraceae bacterium]|nr:PRC-barrel domain-containing protein [Acetobacteraceae bacterium]
MIGLRSTGIAVVLTVGLGLTALAQTPPSSPPGPAAGTSPTATSATVPTGSAQKSQDYWRGRTLTGTPVFNDNGQRIATINDLLITEDGRVNQAILSLRRPRGKLVAVPFDQLHFVPSRSSPLTRVPAGLAGGMAVTHHWPSVETYGAVLPGATLDSLASMERFRFSQ